MPKNITPSVTPGKAASLTIPTPGDKLKASVLEAIFQAILDYLKNLDNNSETAASLLTKLKTVDGVGSLLDADLLDGFSSEQFWKKTETPFDTSKIFIHSGRWVGDWDGSPLLLEPGNGAEVGYIPYMLAPQKKMVLNYLVYHNETETFALRFNPSGLEYLPTASGPVGATIQTNGNPIGGATVRGVFGLDIMNRAATNQTLYRGVWYAVLEVQDI